MCFSHIKILSTLSCLIIFAAILPVSLQAQDDFSSPGIEFEPEAPDSPQIPPEFDAQPPTGESGFEMPSMQDGFGVPPPKEFSPQQDAPKGPIPGKPYIKLQRALPNDKTPNAQKKTPTVVSPTPKPEPKKSLPKLTQPKKKTPTKVKPIKAQKKLSLEPIPSDSPATDSPSIPLVNSIGSSSTTASDPSSGTKTIEFKDIKATVTVISQTGGNPSQISEAKALIQNGRITEAQSILEQIPNGSGLASVNFYQGLCFFRLGKFSMASHHFEKSLKIEPNLDTSSWLAQSYHLEKAYEKANDLLSQLVKGRAVPADHILQAMNYEKWGKNAEAKAIYAQATELFPSDVSLMVSYADFLSRSGTREQAIELYQQAIKTSPQNIAPVLGLAKLYQGQGKWNEVIETCRSFLDSAKTKDTDCIDLGNLAFNKKGDKAGAAAWKKKYTN